MGVVFFYHLTQTPLETTLPMLLEKSLQAGWRVVIRGTDQARIDWLDEKLWLGDAGFLAHGKSGGDHDDAQPIILTTDPQTKNNPSCLMAIDGASVSPEEVSQLSRTCILFDGNDQTALEAARGQWKALTGAGCAAEYWSQETGNWAKKAEHKPE